MYLIRSANEGTHLLGALTFCGWPLHQPIDWHSWFSEIPPTSPMVDPFAEVIAHPCRAGQPTLLKIQTQGIVCAFVNKAVLLQTPQNCLKA